MNQREAAHDDFKNALAIAVGREVADLAYVILELRKELQEARQAAWWLCDLIDRWGIVADHRRRWPWLRKGGCDDTRTED